MSYTITDILTPFLSLPRPKSQLITSLTASTTEIKDVVRAFVKIVSWDTCWSRV